MMFRIPLIRSATALLSAALLSASAHAAPVTYAFVSKLSRVSFNLEHQGFIQLYGSLRIAPGSFVFDAEDWSKSSVQVSLPLRSLDMGDALWNTQIRGDSAWGQLFQTASIDFRSTRLEQLDAHNGLMHGQLTLAGVTRPVSLKLRFNKLGRNEVNEKASVGFAATTTLKRSDFGLKAYLDLVGDEIEVRIQVEGAVGEDGERNSSLDALGVKR